MEEFASILGRYDYTLPPQLIAQKPASPRDSARLLVYERASRKTSWTTFRDIGKFLPRDAVLVLNQTKVIPAKLELTRATGGKVSALFLGSDRDTIRVLANRKLKPGEFLALAGKRGFTVMASEEKYWRLRPSFPVSELQKMFDRFGTMPLPPYIKHSPLTRSELKREYQSVFAVDPGSIAAPTASLHFTKKLLGDLKQSGIRVAHVTLHVHLGTFAPLTEEQWKRGELHTEHYVIDAGTAAVLKQAHRASHPVIAVGTTVVRTLESSSDSHGRIVRPSGNTSLFIREGYKFHLVDGLITNFHVPRSSLLMLVSAFTGREAVLDLYRQAIEREFRFFSFGDGMLLL